MPASFPVKTTFLNGDIYTATDVNNYGLAINALYDESPNSLVTAKGDLLVGDSAGNVVKKTVGANDTLLVADSAQTGGVKWANITNSMFAAGAKAVVIVANDAARTALTPVEGQVVYQTDNDKVYVYNGSAWTLLLANGTYTPTLTGMAIGTGGSAQNSAGYVYSYSQLNVWGRIVFGTSGTTFPTSPTISLPSGFTANSTFIASNHTLGTVWFTAGGANFSGFMVYNTTTTASPVVHRYNPTLATSPQFADFSTLATTTPSTWAAGDSIRWQLTVYGTLT